jgi:hypothetical protein
MLGAFLSWHECPYIGWSVRCISNDTVHWRVRAVRVVDGELVLYVVESYTRCTHPFHVLATKARKARNL